MIFAMTFGEHVVCMFLFFLLAMYGFKKFMRDIDTDGTVKTAARKGIVNVIGRLFK